MTKSHLFFNSGGVNVNLSPANNEPWPAVYVETRQNWGLLVGRRGGAKPIRAYFLRALPNEVNQQSLVGIPLDIRYFFTDLLTGCQFLAYGSAASPTIEHNNNLSGASVDYGARRAHATVQPWSRCVTPGQEYNLGVNPNDDACSAVVGIRDDTTNDWHFYLQRVNNARVLTLTPL